MFVKKISIVGDNSEIFVRKMNWWIEVLQIECGLMNCLLDILSHSPNAEALPIFADPFEIPCCLYPWIHLHPGPGQMFILTKYLNCYLSTPELGPEAVFSFIPILLTCFGQVADILFSDIMMINLKYSYCIPQRVAEVYWTGRIRPHSQLK